MISEEGAGYDADSIYWARMARRLLALGLACVIIGVPLAGDVCAVVCAEHVGRSAGAIHNHHSPTAANQPSHHGHSTAAPAVAMWRTELTPVPAGCRHLEALVTESRELTPAPIVKAVVTMTLVTRALVRVLPAFETESRHGPPAPVHSTSSLRI